MKSYGVDKINLKLFNTILLINSCGDAIIPKDINGTDEKEELRVNILNSVENIIKYFSLFEPNDRFCILSLSNRFKKFINNFNKWKEIDIITIVQSFGSLYYKFEDIIKLIKRDRENEKLHIDELEKIERIKDVQNNIITKIKSIGGYDIFKKMKPVVVEFDSSLTNNIKKKVEDSYWKILEENLKEYPVNKKLLVKLLKEIKLIIYNLFVKNINILADVEKNININFIEKEKNLDTHYIVSCIDYYFDFLKKIQSSSMDEETNLNHKLLKSSLIQGDELYEFIPKSLRYLLQSYYKVLDATNNVKNELKNKNNII